MTGTSTNGLKDRTMNQILTEKRLQFDFRNAISAEKFDDDTEGNSKPQGMSFVDFVVEEKDRLFLIEVKDPSIDKALPGAQKKFVDSLKSSDLIEAHLVPKARDSYTFLHLMMRGENKVKDYIFILGDENLDIEPALLLELNRRLGKKLAQETNVPWKRKYIRENYIVNLEGWKKHFPQYPLEISTL